MFSNSKNHFKQFETNNSTISKLKNYVNEMFDEAAMN